MTLKELFVKIGFDVEKDKLDGVEKQLEGIHHLLEAFAAVEVIKGVVEMTEKFGEMAEHLHLAATSAGITTEAFQKLAFAAQQNGVSQDELSGAMARISRNLYDARIGSEEAQKTFTQAGFTADQVRGFKNGSDVLHALSDRFKGMKDPIKEIGILMPLAGRGSRDMVAFMEKGSAGMKQLEDQAESLGAVLSGEQVEALVEAQHSFTALTSVIKTFSATIAAYFAPSIKSAIDEFLQFYAINKDIIQLEIKKWVWDITYAMGAVWAVVKFVAQSFLDFAKNHETLTRRGGELVLIMGALGSVIFALAKAFQIAKTVMEPLITIVKNLGAVMEFLEGVVMGPVGAIALLVVAIHDLWNAAHGKPTWINQMIEFLGIGKQVETVFFSIFDVISDLINLDFSKLFKDIKGDIGGLLGAVGKLQPGVMGWAAGKLGDLISSPAASNVAQAQALSGNQPGLSTQAINNMLGGNSSSVEVNAPVTINVPAGTDPGMVGDKVQEGIQQHFDRVHRETQRSLRPALSY